jgi:hypothetical protein
MPPLQGPWLDSPTHQQGPILWLPLPAEQRQEGQRCLCRCRVLHRPAQQLRHPWLSKQTQQLQPTQLLDGRRRGAVVKQGLQPGLTKGRSSRKRGPLRQSGLEQWCRVTSHVGGQQALDLRAIKQGDQCRQQIGLGRQRSVNQSLNPSLGIRQPTAQLLQLLPAEFTAGFSQANGDV